MSVPNRQTSVASIRSALLRAFMLLGVALLLAPAAHASTIAATFDQTGGGTFSFSDQTMGWEFSLSTTIAVTDLGVFDDGLNGLNSDHEIGIWNVLNTLSPVAYAKVLAGTGNPLTNQFRYAAVSGGPAVLGPGTYVIGASYAGYLLGDDYLASGGLTNFATGAGVTYMQDRYSGVAGLNFPASGVGGGFDPAIFGPDFKYDPVPEPASLVLLGSGLLAAVRRARKTRAAR